LNGIPGNLHKVNESEKSEKRPKQKKKEEAIVACMTCLWANYARILIKHGPRPWPGLVQDHI